MDALHRALAELEECDHEPRDKFPVADVGVVRPDAEQLVAAIQGNDERAAADAADSAPAKGSVPEDDLLVSTGPDQPLEAKKAPLCPEIYDEALADHRLDDQEYEKLLSELRPGQRFIVDWLHHVYTTRRDFALGKVDETYAPFCLFVSGAGGTGKTFLLRAMREKIERLTETKGNGRLPRVMVAASTGIAASHIPGAGTYHLKLAIRPGNTREGFVTTARAVILRN